ncbi:SMODS domain-containing nucleotidyltransferase [Asaia bogorensis]|uniref:SMODS domain-containing nucleotidyltransferase n=1 Tax=Asaia bogorensis TaxID=91915 RepID=UPI0028543D09|nr:hypothetical protein [Asaia bogorensis NBRC 16594]
MSVSKRFDIFLRNISLTDIQKAEGASRREAVVKALNIHYWGSASGTSNSSYVGSWAKYTRIRPPRDVDILFTLPISVFHRYEQRQGNKQSQLLQEIKIILGNRFPNTSIRGDGPVVLVPFSTYNVELIPSFNLTNGQSWICVTTNGGRYTTADYIAEANEIKSSNDLTNGNTRNLIRMLKCWQYECGVQLKSFVLEILSVEFLRTWDNRDKSHIYYDWMIRDFFQFLLSKSNGCVFAPGTFQAISLGSAWQSKAYSALRNAQKACEYESKHLTNLAGDEWQKIFGTNIPKFL